MMEVMYLVFHNGAEAHSPRKTNYRVHSYQTLERIYGSRGEKPVPERGCLIQV